MYVLRILLDIYIYVYLLLHLNLLVLYAIYDEYKTLY